MRKQLGFMLICICMCIITLSGCGNSKTDSGSSIKSEINGDKETNKEENKETNKETNKEANKETNKKISGVTDKGVNEAADSNIAADKSTNKDINKDTDKDTNIDTNIDTNTGINKNIEANMDTDGDINIESSVTDLLDSRTDIPEIIPNTIAVEINPDNWACYFEIKEELIGTENAFQEWDYSVEHSYVVWKMCLKSEYRDRVDRDSDSIVLFEIGYDHQYNEVDYDEENKTYTPTGYVWEVFNSHGSTTFEYDAFFADGASIAVSSFPFEYVGEKATHGFDRYYNMEVTRVQGTLCLIE